MRIGKVKRVIKNVPAPIIIKPPKPIPAPDIFKKPKKVEVVK